MNHPVSVGRRFLRSLSAEARAGLSSLGWSYLSHAVQLALRLGSSLILTRLLLPDAYGIFGPALAVLVLLELFADIGVWQTVVRSPRGDDPRFLGTAWSILMVRSIPLAAACAGLSLVLPVWYGQPAMADVLLTLACRPVLLAFVNPTLFILHRRLDYKTPFRVELLQSLVAIPMTVVLAWIIRNEWALALGVLFGDLVRLAFSHIVYPRAPRPCWDRSAVRELARFGSAIFVNTLVYGGWLYFDRLAGAALLPAAELGLYVLAWNLAEAGDQLIGRSRDVFFSMLSRRPEGPERTAFLERSARRVVALLIPIVAGAAVAAPWLFRLLYARPFHGAAVLFGLLTVRLMLAAIGQVQFAYILVRGRVMLATLAYLAALAVQASILPLLVGRLGVLGTAVATLISMAAFVAVQALFAWRYLNVSGRPVLTTLTWAAATATLIIWLR